MQSVALRVDASPAIGIGHVIRSLTLADALARRGLRILVISRHMPPHLQALVTSRGHVWRSLTDRAEPAEYDAVPHASWLGTSQAADAAETLRVMAGESWQWVVVDHYALDHRWESQVRQLAGGVCVVDDVADRRHDCDVLMDQNLYSDMHVRYAGKVSDACTPLLGPKYSLLRPDFAHLRRQTTPGDGAVKRIMVLLGGMDAPNHTAKVVRALAQLAGEAPFDVDVVIGRQHPASEEVASLCRTSGFHCHVQVEDIASMMLAADLAIGASGSTSWERCALGLPTLCLTHADNQVAIAQGLATAGAVVNLGDGDLLSESDIAGAVRALLGDPARVRAMSQAAWDITDGLGAERVADVLQQEAR